MEPLTIILVLGILILGILIGYFLGHKLGVLKRDRHWELQLPIHRKDAVSRSRAVLSGQFSEQLAPFLPGFQYNPNEARFIGKPVDFIVFKGLDNREIEEIVFVEVKSGNAKLNNTEKSLKKAVEKGKVRFEGYRVPEEVGRE